VPLLRDHPIHAERLGSGRRISCDGWRGRAIEANARDLSVESTCRNQLPT
jgi:hypothetical protein